MMKQRNSPQEEQQEEKYGNAKSFSGYPRRNFSLQVEHEIRRAEHSGKDDRGDNEEKCETDEVEGAGCRANGVCGPSHRALGECAAGFDEVVHDKRHAHNERRRNGEQDGDKGAFGHGEHDEAGDEIGPENDGGHATIHQQHKAHKLRSSLECTIAGDRHVNKGIVCEAQ